MPIKLENLGVAVRDLEATIAFFTDLGLTALGRDTVSGEWTDTAVGLDGNHAHIAMLQTPDGNGRLGLFEYIHPRRDRDEPTRPNEIGMHCLAFSVDNLEETSRSPRGTAATRCAAWRPTRTCTSSPMSATQRHHRDPCRGTEELTAGRWAHGVCR
jgi:glyoxylase I family protein